MPRNIYTDAAISAVPHLSHIGVSIREDVLSGVAQEWSGYELKTPTWEDPTSPHPDDEYMLEFLGVQNAINFCFRDFKTGEDFDAEYEGKIYKGSRALAACLMRAHKEGIPIFNPEYLNNIGNNNLRSILKHTNTEIPLYWQRVHNLEDIGSMLLHGPQKSFTEIFEACEFKAFNRGRGIVETLVTRFSAYRDVSTYAGYEIPFHKRAMLLVLLYHALARRSKNPRFKPIQDIASIGPISDYQVPKSLRAIGILEYSETISEMVDNGVEIPTHSDIEIAIRAHTIAAVEQLLVEINEIRSYETAYPPITMAELDYPLWNAARRILGKHHYTSTTAY